MKNALAILSMTVLTGLIMSACGSDGPGTNDQARKEAADLVTEAETAYVSASGKMNAIFKESPGANKVAFMKGKKAQFEEVSSGFKTAAEKFEMASAKFDRALNGGRSGDSPLHTRFARLRDAYKKFSELAAVENQVAREAINIKDVESFLTKLKTLELKMDELRKEVDSQMSSARAAF